VKPLSRQEAELVWTSYRCISLSAVFSKVFKKAMHSRLSQHLNTNNILVTTVWLGKGISTKNAP